MGASKENLITLIVASAQRSLSRMFPGFAATSTKHNHWFDFGFPDSLTFEHFYTLYKRNGIARAGVVRPIEKCWQDNPWLQEKEGTHDETPAEKEIRLAFQRLQFWQKLKTADERSRVGSYAGVIFRFADNQQHSQPVTTVPGGLAGLVEIIPVFERQLEVARFDEIPTSPTFGQPEMYKFTESAVGTGKSGRSYEVHPDRVHIWSPDSSLYGESALEAGYNDLVTIEKVIGAGGEGFWKNAKSAPVLNLDKDANINSLATMLGVPVEKIADKMDEVVADFQKGFDQVLMTQGMEAKTLAITLPDPEKFVLVALQSFAASVPIPLKILLGSQSGERASTEDAKEWNQTCQTRRTQIVVPNIQRIIEKLKKFNVLKGKEWIVSVTDLTEATMDDKINRADKMAGINQKLLGTGERVFTTDEIRETVDLEPSDDLGIELPDDVEADAEAK